MWKSRGDASWVGGNGETLLHKASKYGMCEVIEALILRGASIDATKNNGFTPLHTAAWKNQTECIETLLIHKADISVTDPDGYTALDIAEGFGNKQAADLLRVRTGSSRVMMEVVVS